MSTVNLYPQLTYHDDAEIIGDLNGLIALRDALSTVLDSKYKKPCRINVYASDGEGYLLSVVCIGNDARFPSPYYESNEDAL